MLTVTRIKGTNKIVYPLGASGSNHTWCIFPIDGQTRKGNRGHVQSVKNDKLVKDREELF